MNEKKQMLTLWQACPKGPFLKNWWVFLFGLTCLITLEAGLNTEKTKYRQLEQQLSALFQEKHAALTHQTILQRKTNSQSDHSWIELTLMKVPGLVPEGQTKVFFNTNKE